MKLGIYFTLGDLGLEESLAILLGAARGGASLLEVGLPFSDPLLDGPVVQASHVRALAAQELPWSGICAALSSLKKAAPDVQISLMMSAQLLYVPARADALPDVDGLLLTDIAHSRASPMPLPSPRVWFLSQDVVMKPTFAAPPENISMVYLTRVQGVTGAGQKAAQGTAEAIARIKAVTDKPVWLGFGISSKADLLETRNQGADGGIIGSAFVKDMSAGERGLEASLSPPERSKLLGMMAEKWVRALARS